MSVDKLMPVPAWHEAHYLFSEQERAALAWAEKVTRVGETHASNAAYAAAAAAFGARDLVDLAIAIAAMNTFNRMGIGFRLKPAAKA
jgi:alkylhydroperoxidase family enzyme